MGRVARYKKVKKSFSKSTPTGGERISINHTSKDSKGSIDYFDRVGVWGLGDSGRKPKKRSLVSIKLRSQRNKKVPEINELYDLAFTDGDDFDLNDIVGSIKKEQLPPESTTSTVTSYTYSKPNKEATTLATNDTAGDYEESIQGASQEVQQPTSTLVKIDTEDEKLHKKLEAQVKPKVSTIVKSEGRLPGESKRAYSKRVKQETRQIIQKANQLDHNPEKRRKKKEFLSMKKKGGKKRTYRSNDDGYENDEKVKYDDDFGSINLDSQEDNNKKPSFLTGEEAVAARERATRVQFGEQAERPPIFQQLPRGATSKNNYKKQKIDSSLPSSSKSEYNRESEELALELMRRNVQAQYAAIKARRRITRDFHL